MEAMQVDNRVAGFLGRVLDGFGSPRGTCFQVGERLAVTAYHVLDDLNAGDVGAVVRVDPLAGGDSTMAAVIAADPIYDLAVLQLERSLPAKTSALVRTDALELNALVSVTGVPLVEDHYGYRHLDAPGVWAGGVARDDGVALGRLISSAVMKGMSGAPVLTPSGLVAGVVSGRYNSGDGWLRDTVWIARTEDLARILAQHTDVVDHDSTPIGVSRAGGRRGDTVQIFTVDLRVRQEVAIPQQLPVRLGDFTGRRDALAAITAYIADRARLTPIIISVSGQGGIGKTALAVEFAHTVRDYFPDGQLYVDLRGMDSEPRHPFDVLGYFLESFEANPTPTPQDLPGRAARFRSISADRRILVLLDNAATMEQLRLLLPASVNSIAIVTSRKPMALLGGKTIALEPLTSVESLELLSGAGAGERAKDDLLATAEVIRQCGGLPLALRIAGARMALRNTWSIRRMACSLRDERTRLSRLHVEDLDVRASFVLSYASLSPRDQVMFRRLALFPGPSFPDWIARAGAMIDESHEESKVLEELQDAQLVNAYAEDRAGQLRYSFHDLVRLFGMELSRECGNKETAGIITQFGEYYLAVASSLRDNLEQHGFPRAPKLLLDNDALGTAATIAEPRYWFEDEIPNFIALVRGLRDAGANDVAWRIAEAVPLFILLRGNLLDWMILAEGGLAAARTAGDRHGEGVMLHMLGVACREQGRWEQSLVELTNAGDIFSRIGAEKEAAFVLIDCSVAYRCLERWDEAIATLLDALRIFQAIQDERGIAEAKREIGTLHWRAGKPVLAESFLMESIPYFDRSGDERWVAYTRARLGDVYRQQGKVDRAVSHLLESIATLERLGDDRWAATTKLHLVDCYSDQNDLGAAERLCEDARRVLCDLKDNIWEAEACERLSRLCFARGRPAEGNYYVGRLLELYASLGSEAKYREVERQVGNRIKAAHRR